MLANTHKKGRTMSIRWQDWAAVLLGAWLVASPWQLNFTLNHAATGNACGLGILLVMFNLISVARLLEQGQEIINVMVGIWLLLSPYALDFTNERNATINVMAVGAAIVFLAFWQIMTAARFKKK
jgi:hypothetical protein